MRVVVVQDVKFRIVKVAVVEVKATTKQVVS
jgi:hypothetical protein